MRSTFKILFYINRQRTKTDGNTTVLYRITIDGENTAITTGEECQPAEWNSKQGLTTNRKTNQRINEFRELVEKTYRDVLTGDGVVSVEPIKNSLQGIAANPTALLAMNKAELQAVKESAGKSRAERIYLNLYYSDENLRDFIKNKRVQSISIVTITESLFEEYRLFLRKRGLKASTVNVSLCWLNRLMFRAVNSRIIRYNSFENVKYEKEEKRIRFLQKGDVMKLTAITMNSRGSELAQLMFVLSCFAGMAIADMENLEYRYIQTAADGRKYIRKERQRTKVEFVVPLHPTAGAIIRHCLGEQKENEEQQTVKEKGKKHIFLCECSRGVIGGGLSTVGKACGIRQRLSYHVTRHAFDMMSLNAEVPVKSIVKMTGRASISGTQVYAQVTDNETSEDMNRLITKQSAKDKETMKKETCEPSEVSIYKMKETAQKQMVT